MKKIATTFFCLAVSIYMQAQNIGIGTNQPKARLHVADSSVVFSAAGHWYTENPGPPPISGAGRRMMWYPAKAAFRAGSTGGNLWDQDQVGNFSFAGGLSCLARGQGSVAFGQIARAEGDYSFSAGNTTTATGVGAIALGYLSRANKNYGFAVGSSSAANGVAAFAGVSGTADGDFSVALGSCTAYGNYAFATGSSSYAVGDYSFAANKSTRAASAFETVFGQYNTTYTAASETEWVGTDRLFVIGNGTAFEARSNAVTVFKNGNVGIMTAQPNARLSVSGDASKTGGGMWAVWSDARLKKNIVPYQSGLKEILQINPVRFQYNELSGEEDLNKNYVGIIAQEIEKILPSTISIKKDEKIEDKRMFDGSELTYTLINAVKEQQVLIEQLISENKTIKKTLNDLQKKSN